MKLFMKKNIYTISLLVILPFLILLPYTLQFLEVGNDFELYYFVYKKYIFELLKLGHLPLWSPAEASGTSLIFNPLAQFFYIPSWLFYFLCFLVGDLTKYYFLIYTIFAISIFNVGLFFFIRTLNIDYKVVLTTILITGLSLKITELLRFPNALHSFAWFPWILYGINLAAIDFKSKKSFIIIFSSCLMLLTAGYPYYIFYAFILFFLYFLFLSIRQVKENIFKKDSSTLISNKFFFLRCGVPSILAGLVVSPWLLKISQLLNITHGRNVSDINFSLNLSSNIFDQIGSWIFPPFAFAEGWFYFGSISVLIITSISVYTLLFNKNNHPLKYFSYFLIFLILFSYQFSNPIDSVIFKSIWAKLDFIQNFRHWVRLNLILVPIISVVLAYSMNEFINIINKDNSQKKKIILILIFFFILIILTQLYFIYFSDYQNLFWQTWQLNRINTAEENLPLILSVFAGMYKGSIYPIFFILSLLMLILFVRVKIFSIDIYKNFFLNLIIIISFFELFFLTNIQWAIPFGYYDNGFKELNLQKNYNKANNNALNDLRVAFNNSSISNEKSESFAYEGNTYYRNNKRFNINHINNWGNYNHVKLFKKYFNIKGDLKNNLNIETKNNIKLFFGLDDSAKRIFYSKSLKHTDINAFLNDSKINEINDNFKFEILKYNGDVLIIKIKSSSYGWVSFIDTWDNNWQVFVNDEKKNLEQLFGAYKSVKINPGIITIEFIYKPFNINFKKIIVK